MCEEYLIPMVRKCTMVVLMTALLHTKAQRSCLGPWKLNSDVWNVNKDTNISYLCARNPLLKPFTISSSRKNIYNFEAAMQHLEKPVPRFLKDSVNADIGFGRNLSLHPSPSLGRCMTIEELQQLNADINTDTMGDVFSPLCLPQSTATIEWNHDENFEAKHLFKMGYADNSEQDHKVIISPRTIFTENDVFGVHDRTSRAKSDAAESEINVLEGTSRFPENALDSPCEFQKFKRAKTDKEYMSFVHSSAWRRDRWSFGLIGDFAVNVRDISWLSRGFNDCLMSSQSGWLLVYGLANRELILYNPKNLRKILLPPLPPDLPDSDDDDEADNHNEADRDDFDPVSYHRKFRYVLPISPPESNWALLCINREGHYYLVYHPERNSSSFTRYELPDAYEFDKFVTAEACLNGKVYINGRTLLILDTSIDPISTEEVEMSYNDSELDSFDYYNVLVASRDQLFKVQINWHEHSGVIHSVLVHCLDLSKREWVEVVDLGDISLFIGDSSSLSYIAHSIGSKRNCVYLIEKKNYRRVYYYHLNDKSITFPEQNAFSSYRSLCQWVWSWIKPEVSWRKVNLQSPPCILPIIQEPILCLLYTIKNDGVYHLVDSTDQKEYTLSIPELAHCVLYSYRDGWFIIHKPPSEIFFFNFFNAEKIILPPRNRPWDDEEWPLYALTFSVPSPSSSIVVAIERSSSLDFAISTYKLGDHSWKRIYIPFEDEENFFRPTFSCPIFRNSVFYLLGRYADIGLYNPVTQAWNVIDNNEDWPFGRGSYFVCQEGKMMAILMDGADFPQGIYEFKRDNRWEEVNDFRDEHLYLGRYTSFFVPALNEAQQNSLSLSKFKDHRHNQFVTINPFDDVEIKVRRKKFLKTVSFSIHSWISLSKTIFESLKKELAISFQEF